MSSYGAGDEEFGGPPGGPTLGVDGNARVAQSPVDVLLTALATCSSIDVVSILAKRRTPVQSLEIDVVGERANDRVPRKLIRIVLTFRITGPGIERVHAERAIELAVTKYCSVRDSLDPKIPVEWKLDLKCGITTEGQRAQRTANFKNEFAVLCALCPLSHPLLRQRYAQLASRDRTFDRDCP